MSWRRKLKVWFLLKLPGAIVCSHADAQLDDYLDSRLSPTERKRFERHMHYCGPCRNYLKAYAKTVALTRNAALHASTEEPELPPEIANAILASATDDSR